MRGNLGNTFLRSRSGGLIGGGLGTSFVSIHGSKLVLSKVSVGRTEVGLSGGETVLAVMGQTYVICDGKESAEVRGGELVLRL